AEIIIIKGRLTATDREQAQEAKLHAGKAYLIGMTSKDFDIYLRLETATKKILTESHAPDNQSPRIIFTPKEDGLYRIIATSFQQQGRGAYALTIREFQRKKE